MGPRSYSLLTRTNKDDMSALQILSLAVIVAAFIAATKWQLNLGILLLPAAFVIAGLAGLSASDVVSGFPSEMFLLLVGVTFLFAVVEASRTMDYIMDILLALVGNRVVLVPFILFFAGAFTTGVGTYAAAVVALLMPVAVRFARQFGVSIFMMALMVVHGVLAGLFSPIAIDGVFTDRLLKDAGLESHPAQLFACHIVVHGIICLAAFFLFGGRKLVRARRSSGDRDVPFDQADVREPIPTGPSAGPSGALSATVTLPAKTVGRPTVYQGCTMGAIVLLVLSAVLLDLDVGFVALTLAVVLALMFQRNSEDLIPKMPWPVMVLVAGVLSYIAVLTEIGTLGAIGDQLYNFDSPAIGILVLSFITAITSAFTSTLGVLGASLPLGLPMVSDGGVSVLNVVGPVTISATVVDASPMGIAGALVLANARPDERAALFRRLALWGLSMVIIGPLLSWGIFTLS